MATSSRFRRLRRIALWFVALFALFTLAGFFLAPVILKQQLVKRASAALHRPVTIEQVRLNPLTCSVTLRGLIVSAHDSAEFAGWDELFVDFAPVASLVHRTWRFDELRLVHPRARLFRDASGTLNIADLLTPDAAPAPAPATPARPPAVYIGQLVVDRGEFAYQDLSRSVPFETHLGPTTFVLQGFTTRPNESGQYAFDAHTEAGEQFSWHGSLTFEPLGSAGSFEIKDLALPKYAAYYRDQIPSRLTAGTLSVAGEYELVLADAPIFRLRHGGVTLAGLKLAASETATPFFALPELRLEQLAVDTAQQTLTAERLALRGLALTAERRADGSIDLVQLLTPVAPAPTAAQSPKSGTVAPQTPGAAAGASLPAPGAPVPASAPAAWSASLARIELSGGSIRVTDRTTPRPATLALDELSVGIDGASTQLDREIAFTTSLRWAAAGPIALSGKIRPQPLAAEIDLDASALALRPLDPYLAAFANIMLTGGTARAKGHVSFSITDASEPELRWTGDVGIAGLAVVDSRFSQPLLGFADLSFSKINATTHPLAVSLEEIALKDPYARIVRLSDQRLNLTAILKTSTPAPGSAAPDSANAATPPAASANSPAATPSSAPAAPLPLTIGRITIAGGNFSFTDRANNPTFSTTLADFGGTISGLSSAELARADVDLAGRIGVAPLKVVGRINPLSGDAFTDLKITLTGLELPPFTPYSGRFAGYAVDKGKLSLDLTYRLSARELTAENAFAFDQFYLGQNVESPDAVKLPLKLALAILRDRNGRIADSLPIRGNLDDPDFRYGRVLWHAFANLIVKAATAPFSMLGGLFGGGHDLSAVDFATGSADFTPEALARLDGLAKALTERPGLRLEISSLPQPELDRAGLQVTRLETMLRNRKVRELAAKSDASIDPATVQLTPEETARYLAEIRTERAARIAAAPQTANEPAAVEPPPPAPKPSGNRIVRLFRRLFIDPPPSERAKPAATVAAQPAPSRKAAKTAAPAGTEPALSVDELRAQVLATINPRDADYATLAALRAQRIQEYLLAKGQIETARVFLATGVPPAAGATDVPRVVFNLQ